MVRSTHDGNCQHRGLKESPSRTVGLPDRLLDAHQTAELLGVRLSTIRQWTYQRRLPVVHPGGGRAARYRLSTLLDLIAQWERPALGPAPGAPR
jgi:Helix-turn-helix domain